MARRRSFVRGAAAISQKRLTLWLDIPPAVTNVTAVGGTIIQSLNAAALALTPFTVVRTHMLIAIGTDQLAADENQVAALGLAVVSDQAVAVGVTAIPTPVTDAASDLWFAHQYLMSQFDFGSAIGFANASREYAIDSKAMRKVEDGQDIVIVVEQSAVGFGATVTSAGRMLVKVN